MIIVRAERNDACDYFEPGVGKLMKNKKDISSLKGLKIAPKRYWGVDQKAFLTAKFAKKSQRSQRGNYLFIKTLPTLCPVAFFAVVLNH